jgi:serine/threonine protein kinase
MNAPVERNIDGHYQLLRLIGRGGMGAVYQAQDLRLNRVVAVKLLTGTSITDGTALKRFEREARAAAALTHRNIIGVYDCGRLVSNGAYLVMEYKQGQTWRSELLRRGQIPPHIVSEWIDQVLDGLAVAHEQGVVHRDLKPENLLLTEPSEGPPVVKILDFGLAKWATDEEAVTLMTGPGEILGTYGYMSPEQLSGRPVDERTDLFAVGVITFEMLTGRRPFTGQTVPALLRSLVEDELRFPGEGAAIRRLESVLRLSVAKDPKDRARSAEALRRELVPTLRDCRRFCLPPPHQCRSVLRRFRPEHQLSVEECRTSFNNVNSTSRQP